jgi:predicted nucleotidyltransferase
MRAVATARRAVKRDLLRGRGSVINSGAMPAADARLERDLAGFVHDVARALGDDLVGVSVYGSAATGDWVRGRSDVNTLVVVRAVTAAVLDALAARLPAWRRRGFALPAVVDEDFLDRGRDAFPMELDDARRAHPRSSAPICWPRSRSTPSTSAASASTRRAASSCDCARSTSTRPPGPPTSSVSS